MAGGSRGPADPGGTGGDGGASAGEGILTEEKRDLPGVGPSALGRPPGIGEHARIECAGLRCKKKRGGGTLQTAVDEGAKTSIETGRLWRVGEGGNREFHGPGRR